MVRFILILLIIFILIRIVTRYVLRSFIKNMQGNFENQKNQDSNKKEGDITINSQAKKDKKNGILTSYGENSIKLAEEKFDSDKLAKKFVEYLEKYNPKI